MINDLLSLLVIIHRDGGHKHAVQARSDVVRKIEEVGFEQCFDEAKQIIYTERAELEQLQKQVAGLQGEALHLVSEINELRASKRAAYAERQRITVAFARAMQALGCTVGTRQHDPNDATWDKQWMTILYIDLPTGQVSWHFHDSMKHLLDEFPKYEKEWDKHTTDEKYRRLLNFIPRIGYWQR